MSRTHLTLNSACFKPRNLLNESNDRGKKELRKTSSGSPNSATCHCTNDWNFRSVKLHETDFQFTNLYDNTNDLTKTLTLFAVEGCSTVITAQAFWQRNAALYPFTLLSQRSSIIIQVSSIDGRSPPF